MHLDEIGEDVVFTGKSFLETGDCYQLVSNKRPILLVFFLSTWHGKLLGATVGISTNYVGGLSTAI